MGRKKVLQKRLLRLQNKKDALVKRADESQDVAEVRAINSQIEDINAEIEETRDEIDAIDAEDRGANQGEDGENGGNPVDTRSSVPEGATRVNGSFQQGGAQPQSREHVLESVEYREAFRDYVMNGTQIPAEFRNGEVINTANSAAAIPVTVMNTVINTVRKKYGTLYNKVLKTSVQGGVEYPIGALSATFKWISEGTVSPRQKVGDLGRVSFGFHTAEIRIAQSFLSYTVSLAAFESRIAELIAIAYMQAMDEGIVIGSGKGSMLGILNDPRVTNTVTMTAAQMSDWIQWRKRFFSKLPLGYRAGEFIFPLSTVESYLETMADDNKNPIFRQAAGLEVNDGDAVNPNGRFFGREIALVEPDILPDFDSAAAGDVIGIFWQPQEYAINENFGFTMRRYFDEETNEWVDKALVVVDGKILNPTGFYKIVKG